MGIFRIWPGLTLVSAVLRLTAVTGLVALILNAALGAARPAPAIVAMDVSASWLRGGDSSRFREAFERARDEATDEVLLFGDSTRAADDNVRPVDDMESRLRVSPGRIHMGRP